MTAAKAKPVLANWFGLRCMLRMCPFRPEYRLTKPAGARCIINECERRVLFTPQEATDEG